jgi:hypothetical protein
MFILCLSIYSLVILASTIFCLSDYRGFILMWVLCRFQIILRERVVSSIPMRHTDDFDDIAFDFLAVPVTVAH